MTWEEAILWLRAQPDRHEFVRQCYYDDPLEAAAKRFWAGAEWSATCAMLAGRLPARVLDVGAGRGIVSLAFARSGCDVTAVEPDASAVVGRGAIASLAGRMGLPIRIVDAHGEDLPFADDSFDVTYGRAVLHHARDLRGFCREIARVLRPGGAALFVREHVITRAEDMGAFQAAHPLHGLCGGENAWLATEYVEAITRARLRVRRVLGPLENPVNFCPATQADVDHEIASRLMERLVGPESWRARLARWILKTPGGRPFVSRWASQRVDTPGRLFAFLGVKS